MKKRSTLLWGMLFVGLMHVQAQNDTAAKAVQTFSLEQAQKYALENSPVLKNANLDLEIAKKKIWETTAIGLPQVSGKLSASYMLEMSPTIEQFAGLGTLIGQLTGKPTEATSESDMKWGATFDLTVSQLVFSGAYFVGLQTTKAFKGLSEIAITKSKIDLAEQVSNAYHMVLVVQENKLIMDSLYTQTLKTVKEMEAMYKSGFVEETTVDQIKLTANNLKNMLLVMTSQIGVAKNLLRLQMGYDMSQEIVLTDKLDNAIANCVQLQLLSQSFSKDKNTDFLLIQNQTTLKKLQLRYQKTSLFPDVAAFYQYDHNFNENAMSFTPPQLVGLAVNIPIFGSGAKIARIKQAKYDLDKAQNTEFQVSQSLNLAYSQAQTTYSSAINKLDANKENLDLSKRIYNKTLIKFKNGVSSSMELTQAQTQLLQAQSTYYSTVLELVNAKNALEKLMK